MDALKCIFEKDTIKELLPFARLKSHPVQKLLSYSISLVSKNI